jgi:hypothetical protein
MASTPHPPTNSALPPIPGIRGKKAVLLGLLAAAVLSVALLIVIPLAGKKHLGAQTRPARPISLDAVPTVRSVTDLVLGEDEFARRSRTVKGVVVNQSDKTYNNVVVSYVMRDSHGSFIGAVGATVPQVAPHARASFETDAISKDFSSYDFREIHGEVSGIARR